MIYSLIYKRVYRYILIGKLILITIIILSCSKHEKQEEVYEPGLDEITIERNRERPDSRPIEKERGKPIDHAEPEYFEEQPEYEYQIGDIVDYWEFDNTGDIGLATDGEFIYTAGANSRIDKRDPNSFEIISTINHDIKYSSRFTFADGLIYIYSRGSECKAILPATGKTVKGFTINYDHKRNYEDIAYKSGKFYITEVTYNSPRVLIYDGEGKFIESIHIPCSYPYGLAFDDNYMWIVTYDEPAIYKLSDIGETVAKFPSAYDGLFDCAYLDGYLFVSTADYDCTIFKMYVGE